MRVEECVKKLKSKGIIDSREIYIYASLKNIIGAHRYMPMIDEKNNPIFSIHGVDVICYGTRIDEYFQIEFGEKKQESIKYSEIKQIPFWTEMI